MTVMKSDSKTDRIERLIEKIRTEESELRARLLQLGKRDVRLRYILYQVNEPYAVIPKSCLSVDEWIDGHPFPESILTNVFKNKGNAIDYYYCCNTYQTDYHIVKCEPKSYYEEKYLIKQKYSKK